MLSERWSQMSAAERLADCSNLVVTGSVNPLVTATLVSVTFNVRCGAFLRGEVASLLPDEAAKIVAAGFASLT